LTANLGVWTLKEGTIMKKHLFVLFVGLVLPLASGFGSETKMAAADRQIVIGVSVPNVYFPLFARMKDGAEQAAATLGVKVLVADGQWDLSKQTGGVESFVAAGVQGIVVWPVPFGSLVPAIEAAVKAGIPVATVNTRTDTDKVLFHVGSDDAQGGRAAAKFIIDKLGNKGSVIQLAGPDPSFASDRKAGFDEVMRKSNVKILVSQPAGFERSPTKGVMTSLIERYPNFDAVFALNDEMIIGAIDAMSDAHINPASKVTVGCDAIPDAFQYIKDGKLSATIDQFPDKQGAQALEYLVGYIKNKTKPPKQVILIKPELVTQAPVGAGS
jgi:ribose transport system substrate-binding protein